MKLKPHTRKAFAPLFALSLLGAGIAAAQDYSYFYGNTAQPTKTGIGGAAADGGTYTEGIQARPTGFSTGQWNDKTDAATAPAVPNTTTAQSKNNNPNSNSYSQTWSLGTGWGDDHNGEGGLTEEILTVTLYVYVLSSSPLDETRRFQLYYGNSGINGDADPLTPDGAVAGTEFSIDPTADVGSYYGINIPVSLALAGFSIGPSASDGPMSPASILQVVTSGGAANQQPGFAVTTHMIIPEPATALLGGMGSLLLLRRRRQA